MIIRKNKIYETNDKYPNTDWYNENNYIIDETTEEGQAMMKLYKDNYPFVDFEANEYRFVTRVIVLDKPIKPPNVEGKVIELVKNAQGEWEYIYVDIPLTKEQELELKIAQNTVETLELVSALSELQKLEQAQSNAELIELMMSLQGGV